MSTDTTPDSTTTPTPTRTADGRILPPPPAEPRPGKPRTAGLFPRLRRSQPGALTDAEAEALARKVSDDPVTLARADLACADCGRVVVGPLDPAAVRYAETTRIERSPGYLSSNGIPAPEPLTTCGECASRHALATDLAARLFGSGISVDGINYRTPDLVVQVLGSTLCVYDVLGVRPTAPHTLTREVLALAARRLAPLGAALSWSCRFAPVRSADVVSGTANPRPWSHVRESTRRELRAAAAAVMADRLALASPPVDLAPPLPPPDTRTTTTGPTDLDTSGGCLMCGVGTVSVPALTVAREGGRARAARTVWTLRPSVSPSLLGGRRSGGERLIGYTCPPCSDAVAHAGALGARALERSLVEYLGVARVWHEEGETLDHLKGWGALVCDAARRGLATPPVNRTRWEHIANLGALADELGRR